MDNDVIADDDSGDGTSEDDENGAGDADDHDTTNDDNCPGPNSTSPVDAEGPHGDSASASDAT